MPERDAHVDHVTVFRWVQRFASLFADASRFARHSPGRPMVRQKTYVKVDGVWRYIYRGVDQHEQIIDVLVSPRRAAAAGRRLFRDALTT